MRVYEVVLAAGCMTGTEEKLKGLIDTDHINAGVCGFSLPVFDAIRKTQTSGELMTTATLNNLAGDGASLCAEPLGPADSQCRVDPR